MIDHLRRNKLHFTILSLLCLGLCSGCPNLPAPGTDPGTDPGTVVDVAVPDLIGMTQADAESVLIDAGLALGTATPLPNDAPAGQVFEQDPVHGTMVAPGTLIDISVSAVQTTWQRFFGKAGITDSGESGEQTSDGGYILPGLTYSYGAGASDMYLVKTNASGYQTWATTFGGTKADSANCVHQTSDGGYILAGSTQSYGAGGRDVYLVKADASGNEQWSSTFGTNDNEMAYCVQEISGGGYILAGFKESRSSGYRAYLIKTDASGNEIWSKTFGDIFNVAYSVRQTEDGGYILAGQKDTDDFGLQAFLLKTDANGTLLWEKTYGGSLKDLANCVQQTTDGGYIFVGVTNSNGSNDVDAYIVKTDASGNEVWSKVLEASGASLDSFSFVEQTTDGGYIIVGYIGHDSILLKTDATGSEEWTRTDIFIVGGSCVRQTSDGGYIVTGGYGSLYGSAWLMKVDSNGGCLADSPTDGNPPADG